MFRLSRAAVLGLVVMLAGGWALAGDTCKLSYIEELGKLIFFDQQLSVNRNQACATCHAAPWGTTGPASAINATGSVYEGSIPGRFGDRKPPASAYAGGSPVLFLDGDTWTGGMFWDGRATGWTLGDPLAEQAKGPFLNPLEQALPSVATAVSRVCNGPYKTLFRQVWGTRACMNVPQAYDYMARSVAAYERSTEVNPFSSKLDAVLAGKATFTAQEAFGLSLFNGPAKGNCAACHVSDGARPVFTDFTYDNLGTPRNELNPIYYEPEFNPAGSAFVDEGLGAFLRGIGRPPEVYGPEIGKVKVPTLRNVDLRPGKLEVGRLVKAYGHNGYFKSLKEIVHFYNTRDALPECPQGTPGEKATCWPPPEVAVNVNSDELGDLGLTSAEEDAIVAFMATLSDGYFNPCGSDDDDDFVPPVLEDPTGGADPGAMTPAVP